MGIFKKNPCQIFYNEKTRTFNLKSFSVSFESIIGKKLSANLGEIDYSSIPPEISDRLRTQAEIHFQICNSIHSLPRGSTHKLDLTVKFANHLMEIEKILISILSDQKKTLRHKKS